MCSHEAMTMTVGDKLKFCLLQSRILFSSVDKRHAQLLENQALKQTQLYIICF